MAKLTEEQKASRDSIAKSRELGEAITKQQRDAAAAANKAARDAARAAAREARRRKRARSDPFRTVAQQDEFTVPDADDLSTPVDVKRDPQGEIDTSGLSDDQIVNLGGGK